MAVPNFKSPVINRAIEIAKARAAASSAASSGRTDRPVEPVESLQGPQTPEQVVDVLTGQRPVMIPSTTEQDIQKTTKPEPQIIQPSTPQEIIDVITGQRPINVPASAEKVVSREELADIVSTPETIPIHPTTPTEIIDVIQGQRPVYVPPGLTTPEYIQAAEQRRTEVMAYPHGTIFQETERGYVPTFQQVSDPDKIAYVERHGRFGEEGKTWQQVKQENPAAYLTVVDGKVQVSIDTERWRREKYEIAEEQYGPVPGAVARFSSGVPMAFDPGFWNAVLQGDVSKYMGDWEYNIQQKFGIGTDKPDLFGFYTGEGVLLSPAYTNVVYPFAIGGGIGAGFRAVGAAGAAAGGSTVGKVLTGFAQYAPRVTALTLMELSVQDIGRVFEQELAGTVKPGSTGVRIGELGMQFLSAGVGAKLASEWKPTIGVAEGKYGSKVIRKHLTTFRGEPVLPYGEPLFMGETSAGWAEVVSPTPYKGKGLKFRTWEDFVSSHVGEIGTKGLIPFEVDLGYAPGTKPTSIFDIPMLTESPLTISKYGAKTIIETGAGWQPTTGIPSMDLPGTYVAPKPVVKPRPGKPIIYEEQLPFMATLESGVPAFIEKPVAKLIVEPKSKPVYKDMNKIISDNEKKLDKIFKDEGGILSGEKQQTIQLQKQETIQKQQTKQETIQEQKTKKLLVPESLLKPVVEYQQMQEQISLRSPLYKIKDVQVVKPLSKTKKVSIIGLDTISGLEQMQDVSFKLFSSTILLQEQKKIQEQKQQQVSIVDTAHVFESRTGQLYDTEMAKILDYDTVNVFKISPIDIITKVPIIKQPEIPKAPEKIIIKKPGIFELHGFYDEKLGFLGEKSYNVEVLKTQYKDGRRIRGREWYKINNQPLNDDDARRVGADFVGGNEKRSFRLVETQGKPKVLRKKLPSFEDVMLQFNIKDDGVHVERNKFAIDSPGEIMAITMKGVAARTGKKYKKDRVFHAKGMNGFEKKVESMMRRRR